MNVVTVRDNREAAAAAQWARKSGEGRVYLIASEPSAVYGDPRYLSFAACRRWGVFTWHADHVAGCIVSAPGDLNILQYDRTGGCGAEMLQCLERHIPGASVTGNDLTLGGKKVASWASMTGGGLTQTAVHVSLGLERELIEAICTKPRTKQPGCIPDVQAETIIEWLEEDGI